MKEQRWQQNLRLIEELDEKVERLHKEVMDELARLRESADPDAYFTHKEVLYELIWEKVKPTYHITNRKARMLLAALKGREQSNERG